MINKLYSVKDKLVGFGGPIAFNDDKVANRWFESLCRSKKEQEYTDSKYFELYEIGEFNSDTGEIKGYAKQEIKLIKEGDQI